VKQEVETSRAVRYCAWTAESGRASWRWCPSFTTVTPAHFVTIMKEVGRSVACVSQPGKGMLVVSTYVRIVRSIQRQLSSANKHTRPKTSMRSGFLRYKLLTMTGSLRNPSFCSVPCCSL